MEQTRFDYVLEMAKRLLDEAERYSQRPTKAGSKRMRSYIGEIQKNAVEAKRELIKKDRGE